MNNISRDAEPEKTEEALVSYLKENNLIDDGPRSWTIAHSALGGRGMFATRDIKEGELIFIDRPLIIGPRHHKNQLPMCVSCYKKDCPLFPCDRGCGLPVCSAECENSTKHVKYECEYLRSLMPTCGTNWSWNLLLAVIPIRALFMNQVERKCASVLQAHLSLSHGYEIELLRRDVAKPPTEEDEKLMKHVCGLFNTNSFETVSVQNKDNSTSLRGLYPMGALQNHCCIPKTRHHFDGEYRLYVSAALPISAGEELTMSYTSLFWDTTLRRQFLSFTKHFSCNCKRCSDPTEFGAKLGALLCASDNCTGTLLPADPLNSEAPWVCDKCAVTINSRQIRSIRSGLAAIVEEASAKDPRKIFKFMKKELIPLLPPTNYLIADLKFRIISYYGRTEGLSWTDLTDEELGIKSAYCNDLISILDTLKSGDCKKKGLILYELYGTNVEIIKRRQRKNNNECSQLITEINIDENERILEKAISILENDIVSATLLEYDRKNW